MCNIVHCWVSFAGTDNLALTNQTKAFDNLGKRLNILQIEKVHTATID